MRYSAIILDRLLLLASEFPPGPGGIGTHAHQLALQLSQRGWHVEVAALQEMADAADIAAFNRGQPFSIHHLRQFGPGPVKLAYRLGVLARLIRTTQPALIVASGERMVWLAAALQRVVRVPFVAVGHAMEFNVPARWQRAITRRSFEAARGVVCVSRYTEARMLQSGARPQASAVIPNGGDGDRFRRLAANEIRSFRQLHGLESATILVTVGSVHARKGQDFVIRALPAVAARVPNVHYIMAGLPYEQEAFGALARQLGVADRVHFLGKLSHLDIVRALNAADLFVMASQHTPNGDFEGFGIAVVEAALCGCPAVVSDNSGVMEAVEPGETGLVATISDPVSTATRIIELLTDRPRLQRMGELARSRAIAEKTWTHRGAQYDDFLRELVGLEVNEERSRVI